MQKDVIEGLHENELIATPKKYNHAEEDYGNKTS